MLTTKSLERRYYPIVFLFWFSTALPMALFILLAQARGMSVAQLGLMMAVYSATIVLLEVPTGGLADSWGRRRVALLAEVVTFAGWIVFLVSFSFPAFLIAFMLNGIGRALSSGTLDAWFIDGLLAADPAVDLHPRLARAGAVTLMALGLGAVSGGFIAQCFSFLPADGTAIITPLAAPGIVALPIRGLLMLAILFFVREPNREWRSQASWREEFTKVPALLKDAWRLTISNRILLRLLIVASASGLVLSALEVLWQPHFGQLLGKSASRSLLLGCLLAGSFLLGVLGNLLAPWLSRHLRGNHGLVCAIFHGCRGLALIGLALQGHIVPAALLFWLIYFGQGMVTSTHALLLNEEIPTDRRSSMLSIESLASYVGGFLGSAGLGLIADRTSITVAWSLAGGVLLVSWIAYLRIDVLRKERQREQAIVSCQAD
jgi:DHA1 family quinolone resistance protein-like MFS transporter